jgi:MscS family membrane protein
VTTVPNAELAKTQLTNVSARRSNIFQHRISVPGDVLPSRKLEGLLTDLRRRVRAHPLVEAAPGLPRVRVVGFGAEGRMVEIEVFARILTTATAEFLEAQEMLILDIIRSAETCGIELAHLPPTERV